MKIKWITSLINQWKRSCNREEQDIDYQIAKQMLKNDKNVLLVDVRSPQEYKEGHLDGAISLPLYDIEQKVTTIIRQKETPMIIYCQSGNRSKKALQILQKEGYEHLYELKGGLDNI